MTSGGNTFNDFPEKQLPKFHWIGMAAAVPAIPLPTLLRISVKRFAVQCKTANSRTDS